MELRLAVTELLAHTERLLPADETPIRQRQPVSGWARVPVVLALTCARRPPMKIFNQPAAVAWRYDGHMGHKADYPRVANLPGARHRHSISRHTASPEPPLCGHLLKLDPAEQRLRRGPTWSSPDGNGRYPPYPWRHPRRRCA